MVAAHPVQAAESCDYAGTSSYDGRLSVRTIASGAGKNRTVDVLASVSATSLWLLPWRYWTEERSTWRNDGITSVAVNNRYEFSGRVIRQNWDVFTLGPSGLMAQRVQAKTAQDFARLHPGFVSHWDPATFGMPWLQDYASAPPERRGDLDLPEAQRPANVGSPLALAFYWVRWMPVTARTLPVFLPGFKRDARIDVAISYLGVDANGLHHFHSAVRHPQLSMEQLSTGDAWITSDHRLDRVSFTARGSRGTAHGELRLERCEGTQASDGP
jgi:hypothetical protein